MKRVLYCVFCMIISYALQAQDSSEKIYHCKALKKGFYKTYAEFVNNTPSITCDFSVTEKADSAVVLATYKINDSLTVFDRIWGFCDGTSVFIRYPQSYINDKYFWKIQELKKYSTFSYLGNNSSTFTNFGTISDIVSSTVLSSTVSLIAPKKYPGELIIDKKGKFASLSIGQLKKWLKPYPDLYASFKTEIDALHLPKNYNDDDEIPAATYAKEDSILKLYLSKLNEIDKD